MPQVPGLILKHPAMTMFVYKAFVRFDNLTLELRLQRM